MVASNSASTSNPPGQRSLSINPLPISSAFPRSMEIQDDDDAGDEEHLMADSNGSNQTCTETRDVEELESSIREKLFQTYLPPPSQCSIFRVPNMLRRHNEKAFVPEVVSIGPFHHENKQLQAMEIIKLRYLKCLLYRTRTTELKSLVKAIQRIEQDCRECYAEVVDLSRKKFIEMMVIDGCFILEFLCRYLEINWTGQVKGEEDPVFKTSWMPRKIIADLLLLENQLPWCLLDCLFNLMPPLRTTDQRYCSRLDELVSRAFLFEYGMFPDSACGGESEHLLDCFRNCLVRSCTIARPAHYFSRCRLPNRISSVTELLEFGVRFKTPENLLRDNILNIKFVNGTIAIPEIVIEENTESMFRNLIAFEHCNPGKGNEITSYAALLDCLIKSPADALHLKQKYILHIGSSNEDPAISFIHSLCNDTSFDGSLYSDHYRRADVFQSEAFRRYKANLRRDYNFKDPMTFFTLVYGIAFGLFLGILQTIFGILSYFK